MSEAVTESAGLKIINWVSDHGINGIGPLSSATDLAQEYLIDDSYADHDDRVASLVNWEVSKNFTSGFVTGLGGLITLPVAIPSALGASWAIQARMSAAIAKIYGHDITEDRVRTFVMLTLLGDAMVDTLKEVGIVAATKAMSAQIASKLSGQVLIDINKKVGFRLLTKAGEKGLINVTKMVPIIGGLIGGTIDAATCRAVGSAAKKAFA